MLKYRPAIKLLRAIEDAEFRKAAIVSQADEYLRVQKLRLYEQFFTLSETTPKQEIDRVISNLYERSEHCPNVIRKAWKDVYGGKFPRLVVSIVCCSICKAPIFLYSWFEARSKEECRQCEKCKAEKTNEMEAEWRQQAARRLSLIEQLRTMHYREYLETEHRKATRAASLKRARFKCQLCGVRRALHVRHNTYERRGEELPSDLIALCGECHAKHHDKVQVQI